MKTNIVDINSPTANMYGCEPCPKCKGEYRVAWVKSGMIECDECSFKEPYEYKEE